MHMAAAGTNSAVGQAIPLFQVEKGHERGMQLNLVRPKNGMGTYVAAQLPSLNDNRTVFSVTEILFPKHAK